MLYRYIGSRSEIQGHPPLQFGDTIELDPELAQDVMRGGCVLIPEHDAKTIFQANDFDPQYQDPVARDEAPVDFQERLHRGVMLYCTIRMNLDVVPVPPAPIVEVTE